MGRTWLGASVSAVALAAAAPGWAQTSAPAGGAEVASADEDIVVTGSRLARSADQSAAPVLSIPLEQLEIAGTDNLADALTDLGPVATGLSENNSQNFYAAAGLNLVDLRKLGFERTLVLINGRRVVPGDIDTSAVDLNIIPVPLIERVEIVTGGSSAIYGADAVAGAINVILRKDFQGFQARARGGITSRGDGEQYGLTLTAGTNFAGGRGNITVNGLYDNVEGVKATARGYASDDLYNIVNPAIALQGQTRGPGVPQLIQVPNIRYVGPNQAGLIDFTPFGVDARFTVLPGGTGIRPYDYGELGTDIFGVQIGGDGGQFQKYDNLSLPTERYGATVNATYELGGGVEAFFEGRWLQTNSSTRWQPVADFEYGTVTIFTRNPYVPADLRALVEGFGSPVLPFDRIYEDFGRRGADNERTSQQYTLGLDGDLGRFRWNLFGSYGRTSLDTHLVGGRDQDRFLESADVILLGGQPACASAEARARGCQPLNVFNPAATPAGIAYSLFEDRYRASQDQWNAGGSVTGELFEMPAGPVGAVLGFEYRDNKIRTNPSEATRGCRVQLLCEEPIRGSVDVIEGFTELRMPILANQPFFEELTITGAARVSDYSTTGTDWTWNVGGVWAPVPDLRLRAARSRAVRSPTPGALFSARSQTFLFLTDPCGEGAIDAGGPDRRANCAEAGRPAGFAPNSSSRAVFFGGNPNLDPEEADTLTFGATVAPRFIPGLRITLDYYDIELDGAIAPLPAQTILDTCYDTGLSNPACGAITRNADFSIASVESGFLNIGRVATSGFDFGVNYTFPLDALIAAPGRITLDVSGTHIDRLRYRTIGGDRRTEVVLEGNAPSQPGNLGGAPEWEFLGTATYSTEKLDLSWRTRFVDSIFVSTQYLAVNGRPQDLWDKPYTGIETFHDVSVAYDVTDRANLRVTASNIFDNKPPRRTVFSQGRDRGAIYPNLGTTFSAILRYTF